VVALEVKSGQVSLDPEALKALSESEEAKREADPNYTPVFTHQDYLACTTQIRVLDEDKVLRAVKGNPEIAEALAQAATVQNPSIALQKR
jgi:hypothetical protein